MNSRERVVRALNHQEPEIDLPEYVARLRGIAHNLRSTTGFVLSGSGILGGGIFEQPATTMGYVSFLLTLIGGPAFADRLLDTSPRSR